ncbi:phage gp16-like protein [Neisseria sp. HSC-16F19]|nr:regulatory protein GemA [Neisseria sp. HSC-16F19]MCP2041450.1 phage gp16-like protein [Neisseria sp. HSC-16F19]
MRQQKQNLNGLKAKIHIGKAQLGLDDETYRALLKRETGKDSCAQMNMRELEQVLAAMQRQGFAAQVRTPPPGRDSIQAMLRKVNALLLDNDLPWNYAHAMAKRMFGVDRVQWLNDSDLHKLVAALQIYARRKKEADHV